MLNIECRRSKWNTNKNNYHKPLPPLGAGGKLTHMWQEQDNKLYRKFEFKNFSEAFAFMTRVALEAEKMDHHPLWTNVWNTVEVWLNTHSAGNVVTDKDRQLAKKIDALVK
jgi:4a-hydroxytetrahydrobiopterin dehydratase